MWVRILVTGSSGLVGRAIVARLTSQGHQVVGLHRGQARSSEEPQGTIFVDVRDRDALLARLDRLGSVDAVVHAAAAMDLSLYSAEVPTTNVLGLQNLLRGCSQIGCSRFVYLSSLTVIGKPVTAPITEDHPTRPGTTYHATKLFGEHLVDLAGTCGIETFSLRITAPVGCGMPTQRLLSTLVRNAMDGRDLELKGRGTRQQDYIDTRDVASAVSACLMSEEMGLFNIGSGVPISNRSLAEICTKVLGSSSNIRLNGEPDPADMEEWVVSIEKARRLLNFTPAHTIEESIRAVADGYSVRPGPGPLIDGRQGDDAHA